MNFAVWEHDGGRWWLIAEFKLEAHAEAFAEMMRRSEWGARGKWEVRKV